MRTGIIAMTLFAALAVPLQLVAQEQQQPKRGHLRYKLIDIGTFGGPNSYVGALGGVSHVGNRSEIHSARSARATGMQQS